VRLFDEDTYLLPVFNYTQITDKNEKHGPVADFSALVLGDTLL